MNGINLVDMTLNFRQQKEVQTEEKYYSIEKVISV